MTYEQQHCETCTCFAATYHVALCGECNMAIPFPNTLERDDWAAIHRDATSHTVLRLEQRLGAR